MTVPFKYVLGAGGIGDALLTLSCIYDDAEKVNVVFLANDIKSINEFLSLFPKIDKKLVLQNDFETLKKFYFNSNCIGTGILPKDLNYGNWYKIDIFKEYGVKEFPKFVELFKPVRVAEKQLVLQISGSTIEGLNKQRSLTSQTVEKVKKEFSEYFFQQIPIYNSKLTLREIFQMIRGSDVVVGCDSFVKTFSALCGISTICYDNIYSSSYLDNFKDRKDYGHYVFVDPFSKIEFRKQV